MWTLLSLLDIVDPLDRCKIVFREKRTGDVIDELDCGRDHAGAVTASDAFRKDLEELDLERFCTKYSISWRP